MRSTRNPPLTPAAMTVLLVIVGIVAWTLSACAQPNSPDSSIGALGPVHTLSHPQALGFAYSPDGEFLATWSFARIKLWDLASFQEVQSLAPPRLWMSFRWPSFSANGQLLAASTSNDVIRIWEVPSGREVNTIDAELGPSFRVALSPSGELLATVSDRTIALIAVATGEIVRTLEAHDESVIAVAFSPNGELLATGGLDSTIRLWNVQDGSALGTLAGHDAAIHFLAFSPDGRLLVSGSEDGSVRVWDADSSNLLHLLAGHSGPVSDAAFDPTGSTLATSSHDDTVRLWDLETGTEEHTIDLWELLGPLSPDFSPDPQRSARVFGVGFSPDGRHLATSYCGVSRCQVDIWDLEALLGD